MSHWVLALYLLYYPVSFYSTRNAEYGNKNRLCYPLLGLIVWAQCDSNAWPLGYEPSALTWLSYGPPCKFYTDVCSENYTGLIYVGYAANRARTCDIMVNSHALYQLSYSGALWNCTNNVLGFKCFDPQTRWCAKSNT